MSDTAKEPIKDDTDATAYTIGVNINDNAMRLKFHNEDRVLSSFITDSQGVYDLAQRLLRVYDELEGIN